MCYISEGRLPIRRLAKAMKEDPGTKTFLVELHDGRTVLEEEQARLLLNRDEYQTFVAVAKEFGLLEGLLKKSDFYCTRCKSFSVPAAAFFRAVFNRMDLDCVYEIIHGITEKIYLTEEEWTKYSVYGREKVETLREGVILEEDGELYRLAAAEVFFHLEPSCDCDGLGEGPGRA